jgi:hypothetical protein
MLTNDRYDPYILRIRVPGSGIFYRVTVGSFGDIEKAQQYAAAIVAKGISDYAQPIKIEIGKQ